ncbi:lipoprotein [Arenimonas sp.]|uniref:lipoprotein n=1 Tax=Arenimonas sp. TaxID=1872635 RepID=UPI0035B0E563
MNTARKPLFLAFAALLLAGCATTDTASLSGRTGKATVHADVAYIQAVEKAAKEAGVGVVWVNPPMERRDD